MSPIYPFLSTHVEQTTASRANHHDPVASAMQSASLFLKLSLSLSQFDRIWWMFLFSFVSFVFIYWEMILYIYLEAENVNNQ